MFLQIDSGAVETSNSLTSLLLPIATLALGFLAGWILQQLRSNNRVELANRQRTIAEQHAISLQQERDQLSGQAASLQRELQEVHAMQNRPNEEVLKAAYAERDRLKPLLLSTEEALAKNQQEKNNILQELQQLSASMESLQNEVSKLRTENSETQRKLEVSEHGRTAFKYPHIEFDPNLSPHTRMQDLPNEDTE